MSGQAGPEPTLSVVVVVGLPDPARAEVLAHLAALPGRPFERALRLEPSDWAASPPCDAWDAWDGPLDLRADHGGALQAHVLRWRAEGIARALLVLGPWAEPLYVALALARAGVGVVGWVLAWEAARLQEALVSPQEVCAWAGLVPPTELGPVGVAEFVVAQAEFAGEIALVGELAPEAVHVSPTQCACGESPAAARRRLGLAQARASVECLLGLLGRAKVVWGARELRAEGFSWLGAADKAGWMRALSQASRQPSPVVGWKEVERVGRAEARVFVARRPFHPGRLAGLMRAGWPGVARARGFVWLATQMKWVALVERAGGRWATKTAGIWWADRPAEERPKDPRGKARMEAMWEEPWGDRRQELAVLGEGVEWAWLGAALEAALLTDEEMTWGQLGWRYLREPWPGLEAKGVGEGALEVIGEDGVLAVDSVKF